MSSKSVKICTILFLAILVVVTFVATSKQKEREKNGIHTIVNNNQSSEESVVNTEPEEENNIIEVDEEGKVITITEDESADILQYKIPNCYVFGESTTYNLSGYKYFIIKSESEFNNFLSNRFFSSENDELKYFNTEEMQKNINKDFFKNGSVILLVYYNKNKKVDAKAVGVSMMQDELNINMQKKNISDDSSNFITYIIPIETKSYKSIRITF